MLNNTSGLYLQTVHSDSGLEPGQAADYSFKVFFANGTQLSTSQLQQSNIVTQVTNSSGHFTLQYSTQISGGIVYINFTAPQSGDYTLAVAVLFSSGTGGRMSYNLVVSTIQVSSLGIALLGSGPSGSLVVNATYNFTIAVSYSNGSPMNLSDTRAVYNNMTFTIYNGLDPAQQVRQIAYFPGVITFNATFNQTGVFSIYAVSHAYLNGSDTGSTIIPVSVAPESNIEIMSVALTGPQVPEVNTVNQYGIFLQYVNGSNVGNATLESLFRNASISVTSTSGQASLAPNKYGNSTIYFDFTPTAAITYSFYWIFTSKTVTVSGARSVTAFQNRQENILASLSSPNAVQVNTNSTFYLNVAYTTGGALNESDTLKVLNATTVKVINGTTTFTAHAFFITAGQIGISFNATKAGSGFRMTLNATGFDIQGSPVNLSIMSGQFSVVTYNISNPNKNVFSDWFNGLLTSIFKNVAIDLLAVFVGAVAYAIYYFVRKRLTGDKNDRTLAANPILSSAIEYMGASNYRSMDQLMAHYNAMNQVQQNVWNDADDNVLKDPRWSVVAFFGKGKQMKKVTQLDLRNAIMKYRADHKQNGEKESMLKRFETDLEGGNPQ